VRFSKKNLSLSNFSNQARDNHEDIDILKEKICEGCKLKQIESKIICGMCNSIQLPLDVIKNCNYFEIFNLAQKFCIDKGYLERKYKEIQKVIHPDKFAQNGKNSLDQAHDASSMVVHAYNVLKNDYKRANYLLNLKGFDNISEGNSTIKDTKYLQIFMEIQERIEEAESKEEIMEIKKELDEEIKNLTQNIDKYFENEKLEKVLENLKTLKFNLSLLENINNKI